MKKFGLIGYPLGHSLSAVIHKAGFKSLGIDASYEMHEKIKDSELYVYEGLGHAAYEEAKDFYNRVYEFLKK